MARYKTGEKSPKIGIFLWEKYTDGKKTPSPTNEEMMISLNIGDRFPPINSQDKGAFWLG